MEQSLRIAQLSGIKRFSFDYSKFGDDYMFSHFIPGESALDYFSSPVRFEGILFVLCLKGKLEVEINLQQIELCSNSLLCLGPDKIISSKQTDFSDFEAYFLFMSPQFLRDINIDMNVMNNIGRMASLKSSRQPVLLLSDEESQLLQKYMELLHYNTIKNSDELYIKNISRNIIASVIYQIFQFGEKYMPQERVEERPLSRRANYVQEFMRLMHENYRQERSVGFYAEKLFISPKYLSLIIKEMTGRSAAEWIDECVILEAKNLLLFRKEYPTSGL